MSLVPNHRSNGTVSTSDKSGNIQRNFKKGDKEESSKTVIEEREHRVSMLDCFLRENSFRSTKPNKDENGRTNSSDSDTNLETSIRADSLQDSTSPSKDISLSDNNHEDVFCDHCEKCLKKLTEDKECQNCCNNVFPSQAATPRTHLSPNRFYASDKEKTKIRTYAKQCQGNTPVLLARPDTEPSATPEISGGSFQEKSGLRKRKNQGKVSCNRCCIILDMVSSIPLKLSRHFFLRNQSNNYYNVGTVYIFSNFESLTLYVLGQRANFVGVNTRLFLICNMGNNNHHHFCFLKSQWI